VQLSLRFLVVLLFVSPALCQAPQTPAGTGVIEGVITRGETTQPIPNAYVAISAGNELYFETTTDGNGRYILRDLPGATFRLEVTAEGYLDIKRVMTHEQIRLDANQRLRHNLTMTAAAAISGRVLDDNREPLPDREVQVLQLGSTTQGQPEWRTIKTVTTNEKGEYRAVGLAPGEYYVRTVRKPSPDSLPAMTFFPGTTDARSAAKVIVLEGDEGNATFSVSSARTFSIGGTISGLDSRARAAAVRLFVVPQDSRIPRDNGSLSRISNGDAVVRSESFQLKGLLPGVYDLFVVQTPDRVAKVPLEIRDADIQDLRITLEAGVNVTGRIKIAGDEANPAALEMREPDGEITFTHGSTVGHFFLMLRDDFVGRPLVSKSPVVNARESSFTIPGVTEGVYRLVVPGFVPPGRFYLADVRQDGRSVFDEGVQVSRRPIDSLEIVLGLDGGAIEATVITEKKTPVFVVLAPQSSRRQNISLYNTFAADSSLPIRFSAVAPGLYTLFAFEVEKSGVNVPYRNPDFLSLYETQGVSVKVEKGLVAGPLRLPLIGKQR
jgi:hypothetical protein